MRHCRRIRGETLLALGLWLASRLAGAHLPDAIPQRVDAILANKAFSRRDGAPVDALAGGVRNFVRILAPSAIGQRVDVETPLQRRIRISSDGSRRCEP